MPRAHLKSSNRDMPYFSDGTYELTMPHSIAHVESSSMLCMSSIRSPSASLKPRMALVALQTYRVQIVEVAEKLTVEELIKVNPFIEGKRHVRI